MRFQDFYRLLYGSIAKLSVRYQFSRPIMFPIYLISILLMLGNF